MAEYIEKQNSVTAQQWDGTIEGVKTIADFAYENLSLGYVTMVRRFYGNGRAVRGGTMHVVVHAGREERKMFRDDYLYVKKNIYGDIEEVGVTDKKEFELMYEAKE